MGFDLSTATPVTASPSAFDLSTATPVARDLSDVYAALQKADAAGDTAGAKRLADYIRSQSASRTQSAKMLSYVLPNGVHENGTTLPPGAKLFTGEDPTDGMSTMDKFWAGMGKAPVDLGRGVKQLYGGVADFVDPRSQTMSGLITGSQPVSRVNQYRQEVADSRSQDAPLMATGAGRWGNLAGNVAQMAPAAFIPGANTLTGAALIGAGSGFLQPSTSTGETLANTGLSAALGPAGLLGGRALGAMYQGGKAVLEPFFAGGQRRIAARTLQSFAGTPQEGAAAATSLMNPPDVLSGLQPTTAELANNAGISQLTRVLKNNPEYATTLANRDASNRAVMTNAVSGIAGTDAERTAAQDLRSQVTDRMYRAANNVTVPSDAKLEAILQRPSVTKAWNRAQQLAAERGDTLVTPGQSSAMAGAAGSAFDNSGPVYTGKAIQYLKMGLNDIANSGPQNGMGSHEIGAVKSTLGALNDWTAENVPKLRMADQIFAKLSQPINQMDIGQQLSNKLVPALGDFGGNAPLRASQYATALRNGDQLAANATGWKGATLDSVLSPEQMRTLNQVGQQLARTSNANSTGVVGSNTGQNLVGQNLLRQFLGPLGLPQSMGERIAQSTLGRQITRPLKFVAGYGEDDIRNHLASAMLDPKMAGGLLNMKPSALARALRLRQGLLAPATLGTSNSLMSQDQDRQ